MIVDWLSQLFDLLPVRGQLDIRCSFGAPWRMEEKNAPVGQIPYHVVVAGRAVLRDPQTGAENWLESGDILLLPSGAGHILHDGSGEAPVLPNDHQQQHLLLKESAGTGPRLDMLCGRFQLAGFHARMLARYLPEQLIVRAEDGRGKGVPPIMDDTVPHPSANTPDVVRTPTGQHLAMLLGLMRAEAHNPGPGTRAMLNAYSAALLTLALRHASEGKDAPVGLLALAGHPRLNPALIAMLDDPGRNWTLPQLAELCHMSRATLVRHFQDLLGYSANDLLLEIRMMRAANLLEKQDHSTGAVGEMVGYQSEAAFQRAFKNHMGLTPAQWRRNARQEGQWD